ncbi:MAG: hypothetical protein J0H86_00230 [Xanthomonadaceae bacterium]|nr:hypothetical protein [Xanthomonadaceae bacterium]
MEFIVSESPKLVDGLWHLIGRCSSTVIKGGTFTLCTPYETARNDANETVTHYGEPHTVELTVEKIVAYKHEFDTLDPGMTALLLISGDASSVADQTVLSIG